jgi:hypothetical protein
MHVALDELEHRPALLIHPDWFGRRSEAGAVKMFQEGVYRWCPRTRSSADGVAHLHRGAYVAAERSFLHPIILSAAQ